MAHRQHDTEKFGLGLVSAYPDDKIKDGAASDVLGWECLEDKIRLSGGSEQIGADSVTGSVENTFSATKTSGAKVIWKKVQAKLYAKDGDAAWGEVGSNLFGADATDDIANFELWESFNGAWVWVSSPNSSLWKIPVANPTSVVEYPAAGYKGQIKLAKSRLWVWNWPTDGGSLDQTGLQGSFQPAADIGDAHYTAVAAENVGTGNGVAVTFNDTLAFKAGGATRNCFSVSATDGTETFADNGDGTLTGSAGGSGTINYATGAISLTFAAAPTNLQAITSDYYWENEASEGLADFSALSAAAGDGKAHYLPQASGGSMRSMYEFDGDAFCVHKRAVYRVTFDEFGDPSSNLVWRAGSGTDVVLGSVATSEGIYYIDNADSSRPNIRVITLERSPEDQTSSSSKITNPSVSDKKLNLEGWTLHALGKHDDYVFCAATDPDGTRLTLVLSRRLGTWSKMPYSAACFTSYGATAVYGEAASGLVFTMMDGTDADGFTPDNYWEGNASDLGYSGLKRVRQLWIDGRIDIAQSVRVSAENDDGGYTTLGTIEGTGSYVVVADSGEIGSEEVGEGEIGGSTDGSPYPFRVAFSYDPDRFATSKIKFEALGAGNAEIHRFTHHAIRHHGKRLPVTFRT